MAQFSVEIRHPVGSVLAEKQHPHSQRARLRTVNCLERINREIKRRTRVASIFPNTASCLRLVSALIAECDEEWMTGKVYINLNS